MCIADDQLSSQWTNFLEFCVKHVLVSMTVEQFEAALRSRKLPKGADIPMWIAFWIMAK